MNTHWSDWLFWIGGWTLAGGGALLLIWAIIGDRSRGRRRCRKCWYDMGSIEASDGVWTCPECGRKMPREKLLLRSRRRWRWAVTACLLVFAAYPVGTVPVVRQKGWVSAIPSSVLVYLAPIGEKDVFGGEFLPGYTEYYFRPQTTLFGELYDRAQQGTLTSWQSQVLIDRILELEPTFIRSSLVMRSMWSAGLPIEIHRGNATFDLASKEDWLLRVRVKERGTWLDIAPYGRDVIAPEFRSESDLGAFEVGQLEIEAEILIGVQYTTNLDGLIEVDRSGARKLWKGDIGTIHVRDTPADVLSTFRSTEADRAIETAILGLMTLDDGQLWLIVDSYIRSRHQVGPGDWGLGFRVELLVEGQVVATASGIHRGSRYRPWPWMHQAYPLEWVGDPVTHGQLQRATIVITHDLMIALMDQTKWVFWSGSVRVNRPARTRDYWEARGLNLQPR